MLKTFTILTIGADVPEAARLESGLEAYAFTPCGPTQAMSRGFVPPRGEDHGALVETIGGHWVLAVRTETRILPAAVIKDFVDAKAAAIEEQTGRKPRGRAMRELKEECVAELLPKAFTRSSTTRIWIDPKARRIAVGTTNADAMDSILAMLVEAAGTPMNLSHLMTKLSPTTAMRAWLIDGDAPEPFQIDREAELRQPDGEKAAVRYKHHPLDTDEVRGHLGQGKQPVTLALTYKGRVSFLLTDALHFKRVTTLDLALEAGAEDGGKAADAFDADVTLFAGEVSGLIDAIVEAMGGLYELPLETAEKEGGDAAGPAPDAYIGNAESDPMYEQAVAVVREHRRASISLVQRYLRIGYNRAARLLERMEADRIVTPMAPDGSRELRAANDTSAGAAAA